MRLQGYRAVPGLSVTAIHDALPTSVATPAITCGATVSDLHHRGANAVAPSFCTDVLKVAPGARSSLTFRFHSRRLP